MLNTLSISTAKPEIPALDYVALRESGIQYIQELSSAIWTDYNIHDPGLTILEILCFAITDLAYRSNYAIEDLLATQKNAVESIHKHFFSAVQILPNKSLTINDYRKLIIDLEGIRNAWLFKRQRIIFADCIDGKLIPTNTGKTDLVEIDVTGYYDVLVEFEPTVIKDIDKKAILANIRKLLCANRNLCEDFLNIGVVGQQEFILCTEIEISPETDPFDFLAEIFFKIQLYLTPIIKFHALGQLVKEGYTSDEIFNGPLLKHGFIKNDELENAGLKDIAYLSDIMGIMMDVKGIKAILDIIFNPIGTTTALADKWIIDIENGKQAIINIEHSNVVLYKNQIPFRADKTEVKKRFDKLWEQTESKNDTIRTEDIDYRTGTYRNISNYYSIQNHFPITYGISVNGLSENASDERRMLAKQMKGYLLHFDQTLANYLSQLSNVRLLFSLEDEDADGNPIKIDKTYFSQLVQTFKEHEQLYDKGVNAATELQKIIETQEDPFAAKQPEINFFQRRNRFLDHLLARFAESFSEYTWMLYSLNPGYTYDEIIRTKVDFLKEYPVVSQGRASAYNYCDDSKIWDTDNVSGFEKRVARLLGIKNYNRRNLANIHYEFYQETDADGIDEYRFRVLDEPSGKILISSSTKYHNQADALAEMKNAIQYGLDRTGFKIKQTSDGRFYFNLIDKDGKTIARRIEYFTTEDKSENAISYLISFLHKKYGDEGMFLVEHLLLFPEKSKVFMPICVDNNCEDCENLDPYSFRISIVLPAYSKRFMNMDFRRYLERVIRMETPAHIFPKICWINEEQMQEFELKYFNWLEVKSGKKKDTNGKILEEFIKILTSLKNVYPPAKLDDCSSETEKSLFILNQNALGSLKS